MQAGDAYQKELQDTGIQGAFAQKNQLDILVSSLADAQDPDGHLYQLKKNHPDKAPPCLSSDQWIGDLMYQPFSGTGPLEVTDGVRAVSLFSIPDLCDFSQKTTNSSILVVGPCSICHRSKARALRPLLERLELQVWTHLVTDARTAEELLRTA